MQFLCTESTSSWRNSYFFIECDCTAGNSVPTESSSQLQIWSLSHVSFHCIFSSSLSFWKVDRKDPFHFFLLWRFLVLPELQEQPCRAITWLWLQKSLFLLHPIPSVFSNTLPPQLSMLNQLVSFPYLLLLWLCKHDLALPSSFSTLNVPSPILYEPRNIFLHQFVFGIY